MIQIKNATQIQAMKKAGRITGEALLTAREHVRPGVSTKYLDDVIRSYIERAGAKPSFLGYAGFPGSACISINDEVIHGIPSAKRILEEGDIVKIDVGAFIDGFHGDSARTIPVGRVSPEAERLIAAAEESFRRAVEQFKEGNRIGDIGAAVEGCVSQAGYHVVRKYIGHGIGHDLHESPDVPNFGTPGRGPRICCGMTLAIEPMINVGTHLVRELDDGWTVVTEDGSLSAHYENTVALTPDGVINLTQVD
ncbi:MAG: type I methionyl aminopeptidase [Clostridia bacterium]|nr:type I methionyl aminopeptidase [Butyricicoccus sp.]MBQ8275791.1 type I methionyl aminopeptidase [Clostridia bacterium]